MGQQTMDLLLKLAVNLIEHFKTKEIVTDSYLVTLIEERLFNKLTVEQGTVGRIKIFNFVTRDAGLRISLGTNARMQPRSAKVIDTDICLDRAPQDDFVSLKRNRHSHQFPS